jgi:hypothetical protein
MRVVCALGECYVVLLTACCCSYVFAVLCILAQPRHHCSQCTKKSCSLQLQFYINSSCSSKACTADRLLLLQLLLLQLLLLPLHTAAAA